VGHGFSGRRARQGLGQSRQPSEATLSPRAPFAWFVWLLAAAFAGLGYYAAVHG
jgi:hypothetical protein